MWEKLKNDKNMKDLLLKAITIFVVAAIALLSFDVLTTDRDGRRQIVDENGGTEVALCSILGDIKGVGDVDVLIQYEDSKVSGVIVTAQGAGNPSVRNNLTNAVSAVFNIPISNVMVFEKENGGRNNEQIRQAE